MGDKTGIQWTDATWNPVTGCTKVSPGCAHCYAADVAARFWATQYPLVAGGAFLRPREFTDVQWHDDRLEQPLRWKRPRRIFVNSMSDLFHEAVPDAFIDRVFAVMALAPQHTFQILTKRAERMRAYFVGKPDHRIGEVLIDMGHNPLTVDDELGNWPLKNVWLGVSVENQRFADERIPLLLQTPATVRFISAEPLVGPVSLYPQWMPAMGYVKSLPTLDWVIVGGESGPNARPLHVEWIRSIVGECLEKREPFTGKVRPSVAVFVKQLGAAPTCGTCLHPSVCWCGENLKRLRDSHGGDPTEWPEDLRVRQFPNGGR